MRARRRRSGSRSPAASSPPRPTTTSSPPSRPRSRVRRRLPFGRPRHSNHMLVVGVELSASAAALLALLLHRAEQDALALRIGRAVDTNSRGVWLSEQEQGVVLGVRTNPPAQLAELRDTLLR